MVAVHHNIVPQQCCACGNLSERSWVRTSTVEKTQSTQALYHKARCTATSQILPNGRTTCSATVKVSSMLRPQRSLTHQTEDSNSINTCPIRSGQLNCVVLRLMIVILRQISAIHLDFCTIETPRNRTEMQCDLLPPSSHSVKLTIVASHKHSP